MKNTQKLIDLIVLVLSGINVVISFLKGWWTMNDLKLFWDNLTPGKFTLILLILTILVWIIIKFISYLKYGIPRSFKEHLGIYWNDKYAPYCPVCKTLLSGSGSASNMLRCMKCDKEFILRYGAKLYPWNEAVEAIKKGEV